MSGVRVSGQSCYIMRTDRGARLTGVRLLGAHADAGWSAPAGGDPAEAPAEAARWIRERLAGPRKLDALYMDVDGAVCTWVSTPGGDAAAARKAALAAEDDDIEDDEWSSGDGGQGGASRFPSGDAVEVAVQPLTGRNGVAHKPSRFGSKAAEPIERKRVGVISAPDLAVRLLVDALDGQGIRVGRHATLWHAIIDAWTEPAGSTHGSGGGAGMGQGAGGLRAERVVADTRPMTGCVVIVPDERRLVWAWEREGELVAAGSHRLAPDADSPESAGVTPDEVGLLASDWLGWSAQLGSAPQRIVCIGPAGDAGVAGPRQVSAWLAKRWPGATADTVETDDPIAETLRRAVARTEQGAGSGEVSDLAGRAGRSQRFAHVWVAVAALVIAGLLAMVAWQLWARGSAWSDRLVAYQVQRGEVVQENMDVIRDARMAVNELQSAVNAARARLQPVSTGVTPRPVLEEFETLTLVLAGPGIDLRDLDVNAGGATAVVVVDDVAAYEQLTLALRSIAGSKVNWREPSIKRVGNRTEVTYSGLWDTAAIRASEQPAGREGTAP